MNAAYSKILFSVIFNALTFLCLSQGSLIYSTSFEVETAQYDNIVFDVSAEGTSPQDVVLSPDGFTMFVLQNNTDEINQYDLSTAFDVSTAVLSFSLDVNPEEGLPTAFAFGYDGFSLFVTGHASDNIHEYILTNPYNLSDAEFSESLDISNQVTSANDIVFSPNGESLFVLDATSQSIYRYTLEFPFYVVTALYSGDSFDFSGIEGNGRGLSFNADGSKLFIVGINTDRIHTLSLTTPYDITTVIETNQTKSISEDGTPEGFHFTEDGTRLFVIGNSSNSVYSYSLSSSAFDERAANDGVLDGSMLIRVYGDTLANRGASLVEGVHYTIDNLPSGLTSTIEVAADGLTGEVFLQGSALDNDIGDEISDLIFNFEDIAFEINTASSIIGAIGGSNLGIEYAANLPAEVLYSTTADVASAVPVSNFVVLTEDSSPTGLAFNNDGTKCFVSGGLNNSIYEYTLSIPFDISTATLSTDLNIAFEDGSMEGITFNHEGSRMYLIGRDNDAVFEYQLSTEFDLSTAYFTGNSLSVVMEETLPTDLAFSLNGKTLFVLGPGSDQVHAYDLSSPYDIASGGYSGVSSSILSEEGNATGMVFNTNGTKLFILGSNQDRVLAYDMSEPYNLASAVFTGESLNIATEDVNPQSLTISPDGTHLFILGQQNDAVFSYALNGNAFEERSANDGVLEENMIIRIQGDTLTNKGGTLVEGVDYTIDNMPAGLTSTLFVSADGLTGEVFLDGSALANDIIDEVSSLQFSFEDAVFQLNDAASVTGASIGESNLGIGYAANPEPALIYSTEVNITTGAFLDNFDVSSQDSSPSGVTFNNDGTKCYVVGNTFDAVHEYALSVAYDLSTALLSYSFDIEYEETGVTGITFNHEGSRMYIVGQDDDEVNEYRLSTEFDISTASVTENRLSLASEDSAPSDLKFSLDGRTLFVLGLGNDQVYSYDLDNPFDIASGVLSGTPFDILSEEGNATGLAFNANGTKMFIVGSNSDRIHEYACTTPFDLSTAFFTGKTLDLGGQVTLPQGLYISPEGTDLFVLASSTDALYSYSLSANSFQERSANDGVLEGSMIVRVQGDTLTNAGGSLTEGLHYTITNLPAGLTSTIVVADDGLTGEVFLDGNAISNNTIDAIADLQFDFQDNAFETNAASSITGASNASSGLGIGFNQNIDPTLFYSTTVDLPSALFAESFSVATFDASARGMTFNNFGNKCYVAGSVSDEVIEFFLTTPFDLSTANFSSSVDIAFEESGVSGIAFNREGSRMYIVGVDDDEVNEYQLDVEFDISTASFTGNTLSVAAQDVFPSDLAFSLDGKTLFIVGSGNDQVYAYHLANPFDIASGVYADVSLDILAEEGNATGMAFNTNGSKMFITGSNSDRIHMYELLIPYDLTTANYSGTTLGISAQDTSPEALHISPDGTKLLVLGQATDAVYGYELSSAAFRERSANDGVLEGSLLIRIEGDTLLNRGGTLLQGTDYTIDNLSPGLSSFIIVSSDGLTGEMFVDGRTSANDNSSDISNLQFTFQSAVFETIDASLIEGAVSGNSGMGIEYSNNLSPALVYSSSIDFSGALLLESFDVVEDDSSPTGLFFSPDGNRLYIAGNLSNQVIEYVLSVPYDLSTAVFSSSLDIAFEEGGISGLTFNHEGSRMYIIGADDDEVNEYILTAEFDLSTAYFSGNTFFVGTEESAPTGLTFSLDGTALYVIGQNSDQVHQYTLESPFDINSAIYSGTSLSLASAEGNATDIAFNMNGTKLFVTGSFNDRINVYSLTIPFQLISATLSAETFDLSTEDANPQSIYFSPQGTLLFMLGQQNDLVYSYGLSTTAFTESASDDGSVEGSLIVRITGDTLTNKGAFLEEGVDYAISNLPLGLTSSIAVSSNGLTGELTIIDNALAHDEEHDLSEISFNFENSSFQTNVASSISGAVFHNTDFGLNFSGDAPPIVGFDPLVTSAVAPALSGAINDVLATVDVTLDGQSYPADNVGDGTWTITQGTIGPLAVGSYDVVVNATDVPGNDTEETFIGSLLINPVLVGIVPSVFITSVATTPFSVIFSEEVAGFEMSDIVITNGTASSFQTVDNITFTFDVTAVAAGDVTLNIATGVAQSLEGADNDVAAEVTIIYDPDAPEVVITGDDLTVDPALITISFSEVVVGFTGSALNITNGSLVSEPIPTDALTYSAQILSGGAGETTVTLPAGQVFDIAGNTNPVSNTLSYQADLVAPIVTITPLVTNETSPLLEGTVDDPDATLTLLIDGNTYSPTNDGDGSWTLLAGTITPELEEGTYSVVVSATDLVGNVGTDPSDNELFIDLTAPVASLDDLTTFDESPEISGTIDDPTATLSLEIDGQVYMPFINESSIWFLGSNVIDPLSVGTYTMVLTATDLAGNSSEISASLTISPGPTVALDATQVSFLSFTANWTARTSVSTYQLDVAEDLSFTNLVDGYSSLDVGLTSAEVTGLLYDKVYYYRVKVIYESGAISDYSDVITVMTLEDPGTALDSTALLDVYDALDGDNWSPSVNWKSEVRLKNWDRITLPETRVTAIDLSDLGLAGDWPAFSEGLEFTQEINVSQNEITSVPDFSNLSMLVSLDLTNNRLEFGSLESNVNVTGITFNPQDSVGQRQNELLEIGSTFEIDRTISGSANTYTWFKESLEDGSVTPITNSGPILDLSVTSFAEEGSYFATVTNNIIGTANLTLITQPVIVKVSSLERDTRALRAIYDATGGPSWVDANNWQNNPNDVTTWEGVSFSNNEDRVTGLNLSGKGLTGSIPSDINDIAGLTTINLSNNEITGLPSINRLNALTTLNVSDNRLDFDQLEKNVDLIAIMVYSPQKNIVVSEPDTIPEGSDFLFAVTVGGSQNVYSWTLSNEVVTNSPVDAQGSSYQLENIGYNTMGAYTLSTTSPDLFPALTLSTDPMVVYASAEISGVVTGIGDDPLASGLMEVFKIGEPNQPYDTVAIVNIQNGNFNVPELVLGDYLLISDSEITNTENEKIYIPTYFRSTDLWTEADTIFLRENFETDDYTMTFLPQPPTDGEGRVFGVVEEEFNAGRLLDRRKVKKAGCSVRRFKARGRDTQQDGVFELIAYVETNDNGEFEFDFLPAGLYRFNIEYPGIPMDEDSFVEFEIGGDGFDANNFKLEAFITANGIEVLRVEALAIYNQYFRGLDVYPIPASDQITIRFDRLLAEEVQLKLIDMNGRTMTEQSIRRGWDQSYQLDVSQVAEGPYLLHFYDNKKGSIVAYKVFVRH